MKGRLLTIGASVSFLFCVSLTLTNSSAATHVVNSPDDASLRAAVAQGGWIGFGFSGIVTLTNTIAITTNVFLDGSGVDVTLSGGNAVRLFSVAPGVIVGLTNLTLANGACLVTNSGASADGGAIYNTGGNVSLVRCTLTNHSVLCPIWGGVARGGAIFNDGGTVSLFQTSVSNNLAIAGGAAPYGSVTNLALGGAIYTANGALTIKGCTISSNVCQALVGVYARGLTMGGAAFQASGSMLIEDSWVASNQALGGSDPSGTYAFGGSPGYGGGLAVSAGSVTIQHSQFIGNTAQGGNGHHSAPTPAGPAFGGAVHSGGGLDVTDSSFIANQALAGAARGDFPGYTAAGGGGAIYNSGTAAMNGCSVYSNAVQGGVGWDSFSPGTGADGLGGGVFNAAQLGATNCTLALNSATGGVGNFSAFGHWGTSGNALGGGVFNNTNATFVAMNLTIASNACSSPSNTLDPYYGYTNGTATGFQIANSRGTLRLHNSLLAYSGTNANAYGTITDDGYNMSSDGSAVWSRGSSYNFSDPKLGPLGDYGGPTLCMSLLAGSPAIDTADPAQSPSTDQRGALRPFGAGPDMGAYEFGAPIPRYTLEVSVNGSGILTKTPDNSVYAPGATVAVTATPNDGWYFDHWSGDANGSTNPLHVTMNTNLVITAHFGAFPYTITLQTNGQGAVSLDPPGGGYPLGTAVTVTAVPNAGWYFDHWSGDASGSTNPIQVTMNTNLAITAYFLAFHWAVTLQTNGQGTIALNPPGGVYLGNSLLTATAAPALGWAFDSWSGAISSTTNPLVLTINSNLSLTGTFRQLPCVTAPSGLVGWWRAEGDFNDASGNNNTGEPTGPGPMRFASGKAGQAFSFDSATIIVVPDSPSLRLTNQLTIEAWINPGRTNDFLPGLAQTIVYKSGCSLGLSQNGLVGYFASVGQNPGIRCAVPVAIGNWYHAAYTYDQSAIKLYWNGQPVATNVIGAMPIVMDSGPLYISRGQYAWFSGLIDEVSVYNRALSDSEIAAIYNVGSGGKCANQQVRPSLSILPTPSNVVVSFAASPTNLYCLQASTNLLNWTDLSTNGPFAGSTNVSQTFSLQGFKSRYFRLRME